MPKFIRNKKFSDRTRMKLKPTNAGKHDTKDEMTKRLPERYSTIWGQIREKIRPTNKSGNTDPIKHSTSSQQQTNFHRCHQPTMSTQPITFHVGLHSKSCNKQTQHGQSVRSPKVKRKIECSLFI